MIRRTPHQIRPVLQVLSETKAVVIGGQAINLWAEHFAPDETHWADLRPFTSYDLDVLGSRNDVVHCARGLGTEAYFPSSGDNTVNTGKIVFRLEGEDFEVDFLHTASGLSSAEVQELARNIEFEGITLRILHPLHCLESKTVNLITLPQEAGDRQDLKHLRIAVVVLREYLRQQTLAGASEQLLLRWASRLRMNANHELGLRAASEHGIDFQDAIPADLWVARPGLLGDFIATQSQPWKDEVDQKIAEQKEIRTWIESLKRTKPNREGGSSTES